MAAYLALPTMPISSALTRPNRTVRPGFLPLQQAIMVLAANRTAAIPVQLSSAPGANSCSGSLLACSLVLSRCAVNSTISFSFSPGSSPMILCSTFLCVPFLMVNACLLTVRPIEISSSARASSTAPIPLQRMWRVGAKGALEYLSTIRCIL